MAENCILRFSLSVCYRGLVYLRHLGCRMVELEFTAQKLLQSNPWDGHSSCSKQDSSSCFQSAFPTTEAVSFTWWTTMQSIPCLGKPEHMILAQWSGEGLILQDISAHKARGGNNLGVLNNSSFKHSEIFYL